MSDDVTISSADWDRDTDVVRDMFREYQAWLNVDICFQDFDEELSGLPGKYAAPKGIVYIARSETAVLGIIGLVPVSDTQCEIKRLYVRENARGLGVGKRLAEAAVMFAQDAGYAGIVLETLPQLETARAMYGRMGFRKIGTNGGSEAQDVIRMETIL